MSAVRRLIASAVALFAILAGPAFADHDQECIYAEQQCRLGCPHANAEVWAACEDDCAKQLNACIQRPHPAATDAEASNKLAVPCGEAAVEAFAMKHFAELAELWIDVLEDPAYQFGFVLGDRKCRGLVVIGQACEASSFELRCRPEPSTP